VTLITSDIRISSCAIYTSLESRLTACEEGLRDRHRGRKAEAGAELGEQQMEPEDGKWSSTAQVFLGSKLKSFPGDDLRCG
jgi:hypothetical protein